jgi:hypothetical protein
MRVTIEINEVELSALEFVNEHGPSMLMPIARHLFPSMYDGPSKLKASPVLDILTRGGLLSRSRVNLWLHGGRGSGHLWEVT